MTSAILQYFAAIHSPCVFIVWIIAEVRLENVLGYGCATFPPPGSAMTKDMGEEGKKGGDTIDIHNNTYRTHL